MAKARYAMIAIMACLGACLSRDRAERTESRVEIKSNPACGNCSVAIEPMVTLHGATLSGFANYVASDTNADRIYLVDATEGLIKVFGSDGGLLRKVGRRGGGPGEFEMIRNLIVIPDGSLQIVDPVLSRRTTFGPDGAYLSSAQIRLPPGVENPAILLQDNQLLANTAVPLSADSMATLQVFAPDGEVLRTMNTVKGNLSERWRAMRLLWPRADGSVLVAHPYAPQITVYDRGLHPNQTIIRASDSPLQGEPDAEPSAGVFDRPFTPRLVGMWEDRDGFLWLVMLVPSPAWKPRPPVTGLGGKAYLEYADRPRVITVIEVLDIKNASLVWRSEFDRPLGRVFGRGLLARQDDASAGEPSVSISQITLKR